MTSQIGFLPLSSLVRRIGARAFAATRPVWAAATYGARQKKIQNLRKFIDELPDAFPFSGPDLVMGCACGYRIEAVRPFVESLFGSGRFRGEVVLFVSPKDVDLAAYLKSVGVKAISFGIQHDYPMRATSRARYFAYFRYLRDAVQSGSYRNILLTDVRDVVFQKPLFEEPSAELELHYEHQSPRIGECVINSKWILEQFGRRTLARLADKRISCSGTVSGRTRGILIYLAEMQIILLTLLSTVRMTNGDQGVHNYVLHDGRIPHAKVLENFERVATLHYVPEDQLHIGAGGQVVNPDGSVSEIVHQYDRHPHLASAILKSYAV
jgi:hypothetical protein